MSDPEPPPHDPPTLAARWREAWFFLSLLAVLFRGAAGMVGAATSFCRSRAGARPP